MSSQDGYAALGAGGTPPLAGDVVVRDGCVHWHTDPTCEVRDSREGVVAYRVSLRDAWASALVPCPGCAVAAAAAAAVRWGRRTPVERARLALPVLQDLETGLTTVPTSRPTSGPHRLPPAPTPPRAAPSPGDDGSTSAARRPRVRPRRPGPPGRPGLAPTADP